MTEEAKKRLQRLAELFTKYVKKTIDEKELKELETWAAASESRRNLFRILTTQTPETLNKAMKLYNEILNEAIILPKKK